LETRLVANPVGNPGFQLPTSSTGWQLAAHVECRKRPDLQQVAN